VAPVFSGVIQVWGATFSKERVAVIVVAVVLMVPSRSTLSFPKTGQAMRAVAQDREGRRPPRGSGSISHFLPCGMGISSALAGGRRAFGPASFSFTPSCECMAVAQGLVVVVTEDWGAIPGGDCRGASVGFVESFRETPHGGDITGNAGFVIVMIVSAFSSAGAFWPWVKERLHPSSSCFLLAAFPRHPGPVYSELFSSLPEYATTSVWGVPGHHSTGQLTLAMRPTWPSRLCLDAPDHEGRALFLAAFPLAGLISSSWPC